MLNICGYIFYRQWLFRKRHVILTLVQLMCPLIIIILFTLNSHFVYIKVKLNEKLETHDEGALYKSIIHPNCSARHNETAYITWYAKSLSKAQVKFVEKIMNKTEMGLQSLKHLKFVKVFHEEDIIKFGIIHHLLNKSDCYVGGLVFLNVPKIDMSTKSSEGNRSDLLMPFKFKNDRQYPAGKLRFKIRMASFIPHAVESTLTQTLYYNPQDPQPYNAYLGLQLAVTKAFMKVVEKNHVKLNISVRPFPLPNMHRFEAKEQLQPLYVILSIALVLGQTFMVGSVIRGPAFDREADFRTYLKLMGLPQIAYWISWWLNEFFVRLILVPLQISILFKDLSPVVLALVQRGDWFIWGIFLLGYNMATISFMLFFSSCMKRGSMATYLGATIWLLTFYFGDLFLDTHYTALDFRVVKYFMCLNPNSALIMGLLIMTTSIGGIQWDNLMERQETTRLTLPEIWGLLLVDIFIYFGLTLYNDLLRPGQFGTNLWLHCRSSIKRRYRGWKSKKKAGLHKLVEWETSKSVMSQVKEVNDIVLSNVLVRFSQNITVLDEVNVRIVENKTTAILGSSNSGKMTLAKLVCGSFPPTSGKVLVGGHDSVVERSKVRQILSVCPTNLLLCRDMTVVEHLRLIGRFRGLRMARARRKARDILTALEMADCANFFPYDLVEIQRRKLCVAISLMGKSKVIIFVNPTIGTDAETKALIWKFIKAHCQQKTVLLLTSNLSEAYDAADRIAFLANGKILGAGTKNQLESGLRIGYHLQLNLSPHGDESEIGRYVRHFIPLSAKVDKQSLRIQHVLEAVEIENEPERLSQKKSGLSLRTSIRMSLSSMYFDAASSSKRSSIEKEYPNYDKYYTPINNLTTIYLPKSQLSKFPDFFKNLEDPDKKHPDILNYKISSYSIEQAYDDVESYMKLNVAQQNFKMEEGDQIQEFDQTNAILLSQLLEKRVYKLCYLGQQIKSQFYKRFAYLRSKWFSLLVQFLLPLVMLAIAIGATKFEFGTTLESSQMADPLKSYPRHVVLIHSSERNNDFYFRYVNELKMTMHEDIDSFENKIKTFAANSEKAMIKYVVGVEINDSVIAMFSPIAFHAAPASLSILLNAYLKLALKKHVVSLQVIIHSIQSSHDDILAFYLNTVKGFDWDPAYCYAISLSFGFFICMSGFIAQPLTERVLMLKKIQLNTGLSVVVYWMSFLVFDFFIGMFVGSLNTLMCYFVPAHHTFAKAEFTIYLVIFMAVGTIGSILVSYSFSFIFIRPKTCFYAMLSYNQVAGIFLFVLTTIFEGTPIQIVKLMCRIFQPYNIVSGFFHLISIATYNGRCDLMSPLVRSAICNTTQLYKENSDLIDRSCCVYYKTGKWKHKKPYLDLNFPHLDSLIIDVLALVIHILLATFQLLLLEYGVHEKYLKRRHSRQSDVSEDLSGVNDPPEKDALPSKSVSIQVDISVPKKYFLVEAMTRKFSFGPFASQVLSSINFSVGAGELLGIVGPHKAGKTVLLQCLARIYKPTRGHIFFGSTLDQLSTSLAYLKDVGYCSPGDEVIRDIPDMRGITLVKLMGRLRGIPEKEIKIHMNKWFTLLGFVRCNCQLKYYTEAMKRKLALVMALIGDPPILILDEPLRSLDPFTKRQFWMIMDHLKNNTGRIIILTSSDVENLGSFCTQVAILVNGQIQCCMRPLDLVNKFESRIILSIKFQTKTSFSDWTAVKSRVSELFLGSILRNESADSIEITIKPIVGKTGNFKWSLIFNTCQQMMQEFSKVIQDYDLNEESLKHVYESFAFKQQTFNPSKGTKDEFCLTYC